MPRAMLCLSSLSTMIASTSGRLSAPFCVHVSVFAIALCLYTCFRDTRSNDALRATAKEPLIQQDRGKVLLIEDEVMSFI